MAEKRGTLITKDGDSLYPKTKADLIEGLGAFTTATWNLPLGDSNRLLGMNNDGTGVEWVVAAAGTTVQNTIDDLNETQPVSGHAVFQALGGSNVEASTGQSYIIPGLYSLDLKNATLPAGFYLLQKQFIVSAEEPESDISTAINALIYHKEQYSTHTYEIYIYYVETGSSGGFYIDFWLDGIEITPVGQLAPNGTVFRRIIRYL